jgi:hypothetical protein
MRPPFALKLRLPGSIETTSTGVPNRALPERATREAGMTRNFKDRQVSNAMNSIHEIIEPSPNSTDDSAIHLAKVPVGMQAIFEPGSNVTNVRRVED